MIYTGNPYKLNAQHNYHFTEIWNIMRYPVDNGIAMEHHIELAPSEQLYFTFKQLKAVNNWNQDTFNRIYVPEYINELRNSENARKSLNYLYLRAQDLDICVCCTCYYENLCHRSIVKELVDAALVKKGFKLPDFVDHGYYALFTSKENILKTYNSKGEREDA